MEAVEGINQAIMTNTQCRLRRWRSAPKERAPPSRGRHARATRFASPPRGLHSPNQTASAERLPLGQRERVQRPVLQRNQNGSRARLKCIKPDVRWAKPDGTTRPHDLRSFIMENSVRWVLDVDLRKYFDTIDHSHLRTFLAKRVVDGVVRKMVDKWLKAGILEVGQLRYSKVGTPQGGVISPLLANIYLHYVLDEWFATQIGPRLKGKHALVRFCDFMRLLEMYPLPKPRIVHDHSVTSESARRRTGCVNRARTVMGSSP